MFVDDIDYDYIASNFCTDGEIDRLSWIKIENIVKKKLCKYLDVLFILKLHIRLNWKGTLILFQKDICTSKFLKLIHNQDRFSKQRVETFIIIRFIFRCWNQKSSSNWRFWSFWKKGSGWKLRAKIFKTNTLLILNLLKTFFSL
jgi:hypothetical protein